MKKKNGFVIVCFLLVLCVFGCDTGENSQSNQKSSLSPPEWIQGRWEDDYQMVTYTFTENNIIYEIDMDDIQGTFDFSKDYKIEKEEKTTGVYTVTYSALSQTIKSEFSQTGETTLILKSYYNGSSESLGALNFTKK